MILELTKNDAGLVFRERRDWDKKTRLLASINKAKRIIGYEPKMDFKEGLKQVHKWFLENQANIESCKIDLPLVQPKFELRAENVCVASSA